MSTSDGVTKASGFGYWCGLKCFENESIDEKIYNNYGLRNLKVFLLLRVYK